MSAQVDAAWQLTEGRSPRRWQAEAAEAIRTWLDTPDAAAALVRAVTGAGKSSVIGYTCRAAVASERSVLVTVPSQQLVRQTAATIRRWVGDEHVGEYYAERKEASLPVVVCCIPSVPRLLDERGGSFDLWLIDEAHRSEADTLLQAAERLCGGVRRLGFTATPFRASERESLSLFDLVLYDYGPAQALADGVLVPLSVEPYTGRGESDIEATVWALKRAVKRGPTVINAASIKDAESLADLLTQRDYRVQAIHSRLPRAERDRRIEALRSGELDALVHVNLLAEGVDLPWLTCLIARRPVGSRIRWIQEIGRILRVAPGKSRAYLYDLLDQWSAFSLTYEAVLGEETPQERQARVLDEVVDGQPLEQRDQETWTELLRAAAEEPTPVTLGPLAAAIRRLAVEVEQRSSSGIAVKSRGWRSKPASERQAAFAKRRPWEWRWCRGATPEQRELLRVVGEAVAAGVADRGTASDLITVVMHPKEHGLLWLPWRQHQQR